MISGATEEELEIANARADILLSTNDDRQHLLGLIKYWREECFKYKKQLEAYENMRKEVIEWIQTYLKIIEEPEKSVVLTDDVVISNILNILNKVGDSNE